MSAPEGLDALIEQGYQEIQAAVTSYCTSEEDWDVSGQREL